MDTILFIGLRQETPEYLTKIRAFKKFAVQGLLEMIHFIVERKEPLCVVADCEVINPANVNAFKMCLNINKRLKFVFVCDNASKVEEMNSMDIFNTSRMSILLVSEVGRIGEVISRMSQGLPVMNRKTDRISKKFAVQFKRGAPQEISTANNENEVVEAQGKDISASGAKLEVKFNKSINVNDFLQLSLEDENGKFEKQTARVRWIKSCGSTMQIGVQFFRLSDSQI